MTITEQDLKAAEEWANDEGKLWTADISVYTEGHKDAVRQAVLFGIEYQRKRRVNFVELDPESMDALMKELEAQPHGTIRSLEEFRKTYFPIEQVGERHWRIKDGHE